MMTEKAVTGGAQQAADFHPPPPFEPSALVWSESVAAEPATPKQAMVHHLAMMPLSSSPQTVLR